MYAIFDFTHIRTCMSDYAPGSDCLKCSTTPPPPPCIDFVHFCCGGWKGLQFTVVIWNWTGREKVTFNREATASRRLNCIIWIAIENVVSFLYFVKGQMDLAPPIAELSYDWLFRMAVDNWLQSTLPYDFLLYLYQERSRLKSFILIDHLSFRSAF